MTAVARDGTGRRTLWVVTVLFLLSLPAVTTRINASDEIQFFSWLHSWTFDRDVDFENEYQHFYEAGPGREPGFVSTFLKDTNEAGRRLNFAPIGSALLWMPFYAVGHVGALLSDAPADGFGQPYITAVTYGSAFYGLAALVLSVAIAREILGRATVAPAVVVWLGTPLIFYMYVAPGFAHANSAFAVALFLWTWLRVRQRWTPLGAVALGVTAALLPMVREQDAFVVAGPLVDFLRWTWQRVRTAPDVPGRQRAVRHGIVVALTGTITALLCYAPQLASYQALNGHPGPTEKVARKMSWTSPHFLDVLLSPEHGFFFWTPLALVALAGVVWLAIARPPAGVPAATTARPEATWIATVLVFIAALQVYVSGSVESWTVAGAFGQRRLVALTPILIVGVSALWPQSMHGTSARLRLAGAAVLVWWNLGLMAQFGLHLMDRQRLSLADNARVTFVELPLRAPAIVVRYLTDRESLYRLPRQ